MAGPAPKEIQEISPVKESVKQPAKILEFTSEREKKLIANVTQHAQIIVGPHVNTVAPSSSQPIQSKELEKAGAISIDKEPDISGGDAQHFIETLPALFGSVGSDTYDRGKPGSKVVSFMKERAKKLLQRKQAQKVA